MIYLLRAVSYIFVPYLTIINFFILDIATLHINYNGYDVQLNFCTFSLFVNLHVNFGMFSCRTDGKQKGKFFVIRFLLMIWDHNYN